MNRRLSTLAPVVSVSLALAAASAWPIADAAAFGVFAYHAALAVSTLSVFLLLLPGRMSLPMRIFVGMLGGALAGWLLRGTGGGVFLVEYLNIFGQLFIHLLTLVIIPLIFVSIVCGVAGIGDPRKLGAVGVKALSFYFCTTCVAVLIGLCCVNLVRPGAGGEEIRERVAAAEAQAAARDAQPVSIGLRIQQGAIPTVVRNPIMAGQNPLSVILFALLFGAALAALGPQAEPAVKVFRALDKAFITLVLWIMALAPLGVFTLMAKAIVELGIDYIASLAMYCVTVVLGLGLHFLFLTTVVLLVLGRLSPLRFLRGMAPAFELSFSVSSSSAALPVTIDCAHRRVGADKDICNFMLPIGATVNMDGTALYQAVAVVFISQVIGLDLTLTQQFSVFATAIMVSIGTAGIPGGSVALMPLVLGSVGIGAEYVGIIIGVDRFLDMCRTVVNITGDSVGTVVVSRSEGLIADPAE